MTRQRLVVPFLFLSFALLLFFYFWEVLLLPQLMVERDLPLFFYPLLQLWVEAVRGGEFPLWNPYSFCGQPLFASLQTAVFYPPNLFLFLLPFDLAFNVTIILHFFLSGWFVYLLSREWGGSRTAGALAAVSFTFGGFLISIHNVLNTLQSAAWTPLILLLAQRALSRPGWTYPVLTALAVTVQFLGGGVEVFLITQTWVFLLTLFPRWFPGIERGSPWPMRWRKWAVIYALFLGLGAVQILPFWEMTRNSIRYQGFSVEEATRWSLPWRDLLYVFVPDFFHRGPEYYLVDQNYLKSIYLGLIPFLTAPAYFADRSRRRAGVVILLSVPLLLALGKNTPVYPFLHSWIPGFRTIRFPAKFFFLTHLMMALLAGLGWDAFRRRFASISKKGAIVLKGAAMISALFFAFSLLALRLFRGPLVRFLEERHPISYAWPWILNLHNLERFLLFVLLAVLLFLFLADRKISLKTAGILLVGLLTADLFLANWGFYRRMDRKAFHGLSPNLQTVLADPEKGKIFLSPLFMSPIKTPQKKTPEELAQAVFQEAFYFDYPLIHGVYHTAGFGVLTYVPYQDLLGDFLERKVSPETSLFPALTHARFILWHEPISDPAFKLIRKGETYEWSPPGDEKNHPNGPPQALRFTAFLYRNEKALPRAFLVPAYRIVTKAEERVSLIRNGGFDPRKTVLLEERPAPFPSGKGPIPRSDGVRILKRSLNQLALEASCSGPRVLLLSETYYPGWKVRVNGQGQKIYRANHAFRAVALGPGRHILIFQYRPFSFSLGLAVSGLTFLFLLGRFFYSLFLNRS